MIVVDTTVLVYAVGGNHALSGPCRRLIEAVGAGTVRATTTAEVVQEFVHVRARRRPRRDAVAIGRDYLEIFSPLLPISDDAVRAGLRLFERLPRLGAFDAVLAAAAVHGDVEALVSADRSFGGVHGLRWIDPSTGDLDRLIDER